MPSKKSKAAKGGIFKKMSQKWDETLDDFSMPKMPSLFEQRENKQPKQNKQKTIQCSADELKEIQQKINDIHAILLPSSSSFDNFTLSNP